MNHTRLESIFHKKHAPLMYAHKARHTHAHHAHTHDLYANVYTHCGRKGHLAKFCYDRINDSNFANQFVWVKKGANPYGPNKIWVPQALLFYLM